MLNHHVHVTRNALFVVIMTIFLAFDSLDSQWEGSICYARAMIAYDAVVNARLGVPAEHAVDLAELAPAAQSTTRIFSTELLTIMLTAYLWDDSPFAYSMQTFAGCHVGNHRDHVPGFFHR